MQTSSLRPIGEVAAELGLEAHALVHYGRDKAKIELSALDESPRGKGRIVLVSALTPTNAGEGKTTVSIGLAMALRRLGRRAVVSVREPSIGPVFGIKGGGTGGGRAQIVPASDINLHFTGDIHAVSAAHNLLAAVVDNELHFGGTAALNPRFVYWSRVVDMNDRALRNVVVGLGGNENGPPRESRFDITAASEVMAALCLADSLEDLRSRLGRLVVGRSAADTLVTASDLGVTDAMLALLLDAIQPNLVQTAEGGPALVHGGPFANTAHGCSSVLATRMASHFADDVITEAGFGFDLGGEKFLQIKCPVARIWPRCVVLVATLRALAHHGGFKEGGDLLEAVNRGLEHLDRQVGNVRTFGLEPIVGLNVFSEDPDPVLAAIEAHCRRRGVQAARVTAFADGGAGADALARLVAEAVDASDANPPEPRSLYAATDALSEKVRKIATALYGARDVVLAPAALRDVERFEKAGYGRLPVCIAKTHLSLSDEVTAGGLASGFVATVRAVRLAAGAGYLVALMGDISTMPGLPRKPAAQRIRVSDDGSITGLQHGR